MSSETRIAYGSRVRRQGKSRPFSANHRSSSSRTKPSLAVDQEAVERAEHAFRAARDVRQEAELPAVLPALGPPALVDDLGRVPVQCGGIALQVLRPDPQADCAREALVVADQVHLRVVEKRVLVQV